MESLDKHHLTCSDGIKRKYASFCAIVAQYGAVVNRKTRMTRETSDIFVAMGARLAITRNEIGLSQAAMAEAIGVSHRAYHSYEKGKRGIPVEALVTMNDNFDIDVAWLLLGTKSVRVAHDIEALKDFESSLDRYLTEQNIRIKSEKRGAIVARWYQSHVEGRQVATDDVHTWIELVRD